MKRSFVAQASNTASLDQAFWDAIAESQLGDALRYLVQGANVDYKNDSQQLQTALQKAVDQDNEVLTEFLLQWHCDVNETDDNGWTALHYAAANNSVRLVLALLKRHAKADIQDKDDKVGATLRMTTCHHSSFILNIRHHLI